MEKKKTAKAGAGSGGKVKEVGKKAAKKVEEKSEQEKVTPTSGVTGSAPEPNNEPAALQEAVKETPEEVKNEAGDTAVPELEPETERRTTEKPLIEQALEAFSSEKVEEYCKANGIEFTVGADFDPKLLSDEAVMAIAAKFTPEEFMALPDPVQDYLLSLSDPSKPAEDSAKVNIADIASKLPDWFMIYPENGEVYRIPTKYALSKLQEKQVLLVNTKTDESKPAIEILKTAGNSLQAENLFLMAVSDLDWEDLRGKAQRLAHENHLSLKDSFSAARKSFKKIK